MKRLIIAFLITSSFLCVAQESVVLKYNYKKGDTYIMNVSLKQSLGVAGGTSMVMKTKVDVSKVTKETFILINKVKKISTKTIEGGKETKFDTDMKDAELDVEGKKLKAQLNPIIKSKSYLTFNTQGKMLGVKVEPNLQGANDRLAIYSEFPKEAIKVGSSWTNEQDVQGIKMKITYTVKQITATSVETVVTGNVNFMGIIGDLKGMAVFDKKTGNTDEMKMNTNINMQGIKVSMNLETTTRKVN